MTYIMRAGTLYFNDIVSARIKGAFTGSEKKIYSANDSILMYTDIANLEVPPMKRGMSVIVNISYLTVTVINVQSQIQTMQRVMTQL